MPADRFCKIPPYTCKIGSSMVVKVAEKCPGSAGKWLKMNSTSVRSICLLRDVVCISTSSQKVIKATVDLTTERLCFGDHCLIVGGWVFMLPQKKLEQWMKALGGVYITCVDVAGNWW